MAKKKADDSLPVPRKVLGDLVAAADFLLSQDMGLLRPGNWKPSEWAMTTSAWRHSLRLAVQIRKEAGIE